MKILFCFFSFFLVSCSTDLSLKYRMVSKFSLKKNSIVKIAPLEDKFFVSTLQKTLIDDGWLKMASMNDKDFYEITFLNIRKEEKPISSGGREADGKRYRSISCEMNGSGMFALRKNGQANGDSFDFSAVGAGTSVIEMPKRPGKNSFRPLLNLISGYDEEDQIESFQDTNCMMDALSNLNVQLAYAALKHIVPEIKQVDIALEDDQSDMESLEEFIDKREYDAAYYYLNNLLEKNPRSDVYYNLGVIQEARQKYPESCEYYKKAFELSDKKLYAEQRAACLVRQENYMAL